MFSVFQGVDETAEPSSQKGWGFCSDDSVQEHCTTHIAEVHDLVLMSQDFYVCNLRMLLIS